MRINNLIKKIMCAVLCFCICIPLANTYAQEQKNNTSVFENFITLKDGKLMDGDKEFVGTGYNIPQLALNEDGIAPNQDSFPNEYEIDDAFKTMNQMGMNVVRINILAMRGKVNGRGGVKYPNPVHIYEPRVYNEEGFRALDMVMQKANQYGIRVVMIIAFDGNHYLGGMPVLTEYYNMSQEQYWYEDVLKDDVKDLISFMLNRRNYYTGIEWKDDKAILAWQLGNEIGNYFVRGENIVDKWTTEMAAYTKSIDPNHLVADGRHRSGEFDGILSDPNVDIVDVHHYPDTAKLESTVSMWQTNIRSDAAKARAAGKAYMIGEFGLRPIEEIRELWKCAYEENVNILCSWSLRCHSGDGGFVFHSEGKWGTNHDWMSFHWPGFSSGDQSDETEFVNEYRELAYKRNNLPVPPLTKPEEPVLIDAENADNIRWRGSAGASSYRVERAESINGPWTVISEAFTDDINVHGGKKMFSDAEALADPSKEYYYRVMAVNKAGRSGYSNILKSGDSYNPDKEEYTGLGYNMDYELRNSTVLYIGSSLARVNGVMKDIDSENGDVKAFVENGRTLVPVRFISENTGANVSWNDKTKTVTVSKGEHTARVTVGDPVMYVNDISIVLDAPAEIREGRVFLPLRALAENVLGLNVFYADGLIVLSDENIEALQNKNVSNDIIKKLYNVDLTEEYVEIPPDPVTAPPGPSEETGAISLQMMESSQGIVVDMQNTTTYFMGYLGKLIRGSSMYTVSDKNAPYSNVVLRSERDMTGFRTVEFYTFDKNIDDTHPKYLISQDGMSYIEMPMQRVEIEDNISLAPENYKKFETTNALEVPKGAKYLKIQWVNDYDIENRPPVWSPSITTVEIDLTEDTARGEGGDLRFQSPEEILASGEVKILQNPGFEKGTTGWSLSKGVSVTKEDKAEGAAALKLEGQGLWDYTSQTFHVEKNTNYIIGFKAKCGSEEETKTYVRILDSNSNNVSGTVLITEKDSEWKQCFIEVYSGDKTELKFWICGNTGTSYIDDFVVVKK